jgi:hypothetical protein
MGACTLIRIALRLTMSYPPTMLTRANTRIIDKESPSGMLVHRALATRA